jgi:hypothetical protein
MTNNMQSFLSRYHGLAVWPITIGLVALGIYLSRIEYLGYEWLSRAGCLIVVTGIWSGLGSLIQERILVSRLRWRRRNAIVRARADLHSKTTDPEEIERQLGDIEKAFDKQIIDLSQKLKVSLGIREFSILVTGTLLWGFGDIIITFLYFR